MVRTLSTELCLHLLLSDDVSMHTYLDRLFSTVGCHPTRCNELQAGGQQYLDDMLSLIQSNRHKVIEKMLDSLLLFFRSVIR
jgi:hypothetical protein